jgi:hypothetical protein
MGTLDLFGGTAGLTPRRITFLPQPMKPVNPVNPKHYADFAIQPYDFITKNGLGFAEGNVIKYVCRWRNKNGVEDLKKAREYLNKMIAAAELVS